MEASDGFIKSPEYPFIHKSSRTCNWYIKVPKGRRVTLKIEDFGLENRLQDLYGLLIYNDIGYKGFIKKITSSDEVVESSDNHMHIRYWSHGSLSRGFKAKFTSYNPSRKYFFYLYLFVYSYFCTYVRQRHNLRETLVMTITTTTNITSLSKTETCFYYLAQIKIETGLI